MEEETEIWKNGKMATTPFCHDAKL
jgi:hypothetical protein